MSVKKLYSNHQNSKLNEIRQLQNKVNQLNSLADDYYIAQRDMQNAKNKEQWKQNIENYQKYRSAYYDHKKRSIARKSIDTVLLGYYNTYDIKVFTGRTLSALDLYSLNQHQQDALLDPENIKIPDEPIPITDIQLFKEPVIREIREIENTIESLEAKLADDIASSQNEPVFLRGYRSEGYNSVIKYEWLYQDTVYEIKGGHSDDEVRLLILEFANKERRKFERLKNEFSGEKSEEIKYERFRIPEEVRIAVWRRDQGRCARCGSRENLEYDHIVPVSKGGGNTERNIELLCQDCNRVKGNRIE